MAAEHPEVPPELQALRRRLDALDRELAGLLRRRLELAEEVGALKRRLGLPVNDPLREAEVLNHYRRELPEVDTVMLTRLVGVLLELSRARQQATR